MVGDGVRVLEYDMVDRVDVKESLRDMRFNLGKQVFMCCTGEPSQATSKPSIL